MRRGTLRVVKPIIAQSFPDQYSSYVLEVADDDGAFPVVGARWVKERWAGAAPIEPSGADHLKTIERIMLREADTRRHQGNFDALHPMKLEEEVTG